MPRGSGRGTVGQFLLADESFGARVLLPAVSRDGLVEARWSDLALYGGVPEPRGTTTWQALVERIGSSAEVSWPGARRGGTLTVPEGFRPAAAVVPWSVLAVLSDALRVRDDDAWLSLSPSEPLTPFVERGADGRGMRLRRRRFADIADEWRRGIGPEFAWSLDETVAVGLPPRGDSLFVSAPASSVLVRLFRSPLEAHGVFAADPLPRQGIA